MERPLRKQRMLCQDGRAAKQYRRSCLRLSAPWWWRVTCSVMLLMLLGSMPEIWTLGHTRLVGVSCSWIPSRVVRPSGRETVRSPAKEGLFRDQRSFWQTDLFRLRSIHRFHYLLMHSHLINMDFLTCFIAVILKQSQAERLSFWLNKLSSLGVVEVKVILEPDSGAEEC